MAENYEYKALLQEMLEQVPSTLDKREGSVIYTTLAPSAFLLSQQNYMLGYLFNLLFSDTAEAEWLDRVTYDFGVEREQATYSLRKISTFDADGDPVNVPMSSRFAIKDTSFKLTQKIDTGVYQATCEQAGTAGNRYGGEILPVDNINGLGSATLDAQPLIPARDIEDDESLRERFYLSVRQSPYGGNIDDYELRTLEIDGVGAVQVFNATIMGPGHVGLVIGDEQQNKATEELISRVQTLFGVDGDGIAPIGHTVHVKTCADLAVNVAAEVRVRTGTSFDLIKPVVEQTIRDYVDNIGFRDATVFWAKLVSAILNCHDAIVDVGTVTINGASANLAVDKTYDAYQVPITGTITVSEVTS